MKVKNGREIVCLHCGKKHASPKQVAKCKKLQGRKRR